ncbi:MAG: hypothetical protein KDJ66_16475, partial [Nitratireductor sp.]|nr:hypothetical protein [Nitratireductor sp.]
GMAGASLYSGPEQIPQASDPLIRQAVPDARGGYGFGIQNLVDTPADALIRLASEGGEGGGDSSDRVLRPRQGANERGVSDAPVIRFEGEMRDTRAECGNLPAEYQADCLQQGLSTGAAVLTGSENAEARREIQSAQRKIKRLVDQNVDRSKPPIRRGGKTYRAVKKSAVAKVNREARRIVAETETKLLRSASRSSARKTHYARIARAVGSTKTILRS